MIPWPRHPAFDTPLATLSGVSEPGRKALAKKGLVTFADLLSLPPLRYQDRREVHPLSSAREGEALLFTCTVTDMRQKRARSGRDYLECSVEDLSGLGAKGKLLFFHGTGYIARLFAAGDRLAVYGAPSFQAVWGGAPRAAGTLAVFPHPDFWNLRSARLGDILGVFPVYGAITRMSPAVRKRLLETILERFRDVPRILPGGFLAERGLKDPTELVEILHRPPSATGGRIPASARQTRTYRALATMELVFWRLFALREKERRRGMAVPRQPAGAGDLGDEMVALLPFALSPEQGRVLAEIRGLLALPSPANILLQGEVGSGKTAVAAALLFGAAGRGRQAALVAPTDLLARQHFDFLLPHAQRLGVGVELFAGSNPASRRKRALESLASGAIRIAVGTQALLFPKLAFRDLALAVVDEQHRFGVKQRLALREKSPSADLVSMSATPIPRSLAAALYGEMEICSIRGTLPGRRQPLVTVFPAGGRDEAYGLFAGLLRSGERGFLVSPRIGDPSAACGGGDDGDGADCRDGDGGEGAPATQEAGRPARGPGGPSVAEMEAKLSGIAPDIPFGTVHGRLAQAARSRVMDDFREGRLKALVATTIVEVGVDVPGVNVMLVEGAENMGLAQLHQLRGRVGRGGGEAHLILLAAGTPTERSERRFEALQSGADGYALAELDLSLRGPGDDLGLRQSGWPGFSFVKLPRDLGLMDGAFELAEDLFGRRGEFSPELSAALEEQEREMAAEALGV
ncbi:MAG: DEAD/DEAH box helicase [Deltaproteobacteria bacterium]|jgi:ATP-dependent DNA helicase RecG|nr:DEAD/DEAH box helicase [Deltaproteobacteria bacterium]